MAQPDEQKPESTALRTLSVLEHVARAGEPLSLDDVTQACKLPKPTVFRILSLLVEAGLLLREPLAKRYTTGARLASLALDVLRHSALRSQSHAILRELVSRVDETCNLTILDGDEVLYLDRVETSAPLRLHLEPGMRVPLHCTASGKLFLSQMSPRQIERLLGKPPFKRYTAHTITDLKALEADLARVRASQVGTHDSELFDDSVAIAVPLVDDTGRIYAALALHGPSSRLSIEKCMSFVPALQDAAHRVSAAMLPGRPARPPGQGSRVAATARGRGRVEGRRCHEVSRAQGGNKRAISGQ
jgi:IclR family acetate operon transcriptional repressor